MAPSMGAAYPLRRAHSKRRYRGSGSPQGASALLGALPLSRGVLHGLLGARLEFEYRLLERLALHEGANRSGHPEAERDRLAAGGAGASRPQPLEQVAPFNGFEVTVDR